MFVIDVSLVWVFSHFAHFSGSELDIAQSEVGCIVKFTEWPTKEQQSNSVIVSVP